MTSSIFTQKQAVIREQKYSKRYW